MNVRSPLCRYAPSLSKWSTEFVRGTSAHSQYPFLDSIRTNRSRNCSRQRRQFSARPQKVLNYEDLVRDTIKKMIAERDEGQHTKSIADEVLQRRFQHYQVRPLACHETVYCLHCMLVSADVSHFHYEQIECF